MFKKLGTTISWGVQSSANAGFLSKLTSVSYWLTLGWDISQESSQTHDMDTLSCIINIKVNKLFFHGRLFLVLF